MEKDEPEEFIFGTEVDLHCFPPGATSLVVDEFIKQAYNSGYKEVTIIHGKGRSQKKKEIYKILENHEKVEKYRDDGFNWGRTILYLKN